MAKTKVALLLGGDCAERPISWKTAFSMHGALSADSHDVYIYDVTSAAGDLPLHELGVDAARLDQDEPAILHYWWHEQIAVGRAARVSWKALANTLENAGIQVVLPALHGGWGEDGTLPHLLQVAGIAVVGSPARSSSIAMDKRLAKCVARDLGIAVAQGWTIENSDTVPPLAGKCVVKPNSDGSSFGITILAETGDAAAWRQALADAGADSGRALVEEFVEGTEITAAILGSGQHTLSLPLIEIVPQGEFYDFQSKYGTGGSQHLIPPRLSDEVQSRVNTDALTLHRALGCGGVARSDWIVTAAGTPCFLEINTLPGMTRTSLVPDAARAAGISFEKLLEMLVEEALK